MTYSQGSVSGGVKHHRNGMSNGFQSRPEGEPAPASGASAASVQPMLDVVGPEVQRLVQNRARHDPEFVKGHPNRSDVQHPKRARWSGDPKGLARSSAPFRTPTDPRYGLSGDTASRTRWRCTRA